MGVKHRGGQQGGMGKGREIRGGGACRVSRVGAALQWSRINSQGRRKSGWNVTMSRYQLSPDGSFRISWLPGSQQPHHTFSSTAGYSPPHPIPAFFGQSDDSGGRHHWYPWYPRYDMISVISQGSSIFRKSRTESIITWTQHTTTGCLRAQPPSPLQYSFQIWLRNWFPVHYFHPVVFNWLGYKPSKWCNLIPQASAGVITANRRVNYQSVTGSENVPWYLWFNRPIYSQPKSQELLIHLFSQSSADRLIVVVPDHLNNLNNLWIVDLINHFEVMQRQKGWKFMAIKTPAVLLWCLRHFIRIIVWSTIWSRWNMTDQCHSLISLVPKGKISQIEQG